MASRAWGVVSAVVVCSAIGSISWGVPKVCTSGANVTFGGSLLWAFVDTDGSGTPNATDCRVFGKIGNETVYDSTVSSPTCVNATQQPSSDPQVLGCNNQLYPGTSTAQDGNATAENSDVRIEMSEQDSNGSDSNGSGSSAGLPPIFPVFVNQAQVFEQNDGEGMIGEGRFCSDGGLAVKATVRGISGIVRFLPLGGFYCGMVPFPTDQSSSQLLPLCFPTGPDGSPAFAVEGSNQELIKLDLADLASCGNFQVPTANGWGLLGIAAALLALGTWLLRRRPRFGAALPPV
jgi:hypothetical protein